MTSGIVQKKKNLQKTVPWLAKYFLTSGTKHWWDQFRKCVPNVQASLLYNQKMAASAFLFPSRLGDSQPYRSGKSWSDTQLQLHKTQTLSVCPKSWCSLLINKCLLWPFSPLSPSNRTYSSSLKTYSGRYTFSSMPFLMTSGNSSPVTLTFFKPNFFLKL